LLHGIVKPVLLQTIENSRYSYSRQDQPDGHRRNDFHQAKTRVL
jgi:hypothetical protein